MDYEEIYSYVRKACKAISGVDHDLENPTLAACILGELKGRLELHMEKEGRKSTSVDEMLNLLEQGYSSNPEIVQWVRAIRGTRETRPVGA